MMKTYYTIIDEQDESETGRYGELQAAIAQAVVMCYTRKVHEVSIYFAARNVVQVQSNGKALYTIELKEYKGRVQKANEQNPLKLRGRPSATGWRTQRHSIHALSPSYTEKLNHADLVAGNFAIALLDKHGQTSRILTLPPTPHLMMADGGHSKVYMPTELAKAWVDVQVASLTPLAAEVRTRSTVALLLVQGTPHGAAQVKGYKTVGAC